MVNQTQKKRKEKARRTTFVKPPSKAAPRTTEQKQKSAVSKRVSLEFQQKRSERAGGVDPTEGEVKKFTREEAERQKKQVLIGPQQGERPEPGIVEKIEQSRPFKFLQDITGGTAATALGEDIGETLRTGESDIATSQDVGQLILGGLGGVGAGKVASFAKPTVANTRGLIGKGAETNIDKVPAFTRETARRFPSNVKSQTLTKNFLAKAGIGIAAAGIILGAIGSYPFAGFLKEEAIQTISIPIKTSIDEGDFEGATVLTDAVDEMINTKSNWVDKIPYANVVKSINSFLRGAEKSNNQWKRIISEQRGEIEFEGQSIGEQIAERDVRQQKQFEENTRAINERRNR